MLNFLCVEVDSLIDDISSIIGVIVSIVIVVIVILNKKKVSQLVNNATSDDDDTYPFSNHPNDQGFLTEEQRRYQNKLKQRQSSQKPTTPPAATHGADGHAHAGTVESYDPIVGSLGSVSDEGCDELNGVRLIVTDLKYETDDHQTAYDLNAIRKSVILGEVLNNPRFKHPYGRK